MRHHEIEEMKSKARRMKERTKIRWAEGEKG